MKSNYIKIYENNVILEFLKEKVIVSGNIIFISYKYKHYSYVLPYYGQFLGICIGVFKNSLTTKIHLRNVLFGEGVEFKPYIYSPNITTISILKIVKGKYVRSKLYYLRKRVLWQSTILYKSFIV